VTNKYVWLVGILLLMVGGIVVFAVTLPNTGEAVQGPDPGQRLPAFAAPTATGAASGDANVCQKRPCQRTAGSLPACEVRSDDVVTVCPRYRRPLVLTFLVSSGTDCEPQVDRVERIRRAFPSIEFVTVVSGDSQRQARGLARARRWRAPVAVDEDGAVVDLYGVGVCPVTVFASGGRVRDTSIGNLTEEQLRRRAQRLMG
jgi:hypothetical protein